YAISQKNEIRTSIPDHLLVEAEKLVGSGITIETKTSYAAGLLRWHQFCDEENVPEEDRMPASYVLIAAFVSRHAGKYSGSTIRSWLSALRAWHVLNHASWPEKSPWLTLARRAANQLGSHRRRPSRVPVTLQHLLCLRSRLDLSTPFHCAVW
ncbi:hypothetical protein EV361DRAFT_766251, partial [Lentinula raphanica]